MKLLFMVGIYKNKKKIMKMVIPQTDLYANDSKICISRFDLSSSSSLLLLQTFKWRRNMTRFSNRTLLL